MRKFDVDGSNEIGSSTTSGIWFPHVMYEGRVTSVESGLSENGGATLQMKGGPGRVIGKEIGMIGAGSV